jgi:peptide/nickel transport system substrate-binding protein
MRKILAAIALLAALAGCSSGSSSNGSSQLSGTTTKLTTVTPAAHGAVSTVTWDLPLGEPSSLDWIYAWDYGSDNTVLSNICESLLRQTPSGQLVPALAKSVSTPDATTYVYNLRSGVRFSDGHRMTAADVALSLNRNLETRPGPGGPSYWQVWYANVESITATGPMQVTVKLKHPDVLFGEMMSTPAGAVGEKAYIQQKGASYGTATGGVMCTGPYQLSSWTPGSDIVLTPNKYYWDAVLKPHVATFKFDFITSDATLTTALTTGQVDGVWEPPLSSLNTLRSSGTGNLYYGPGTSVETVQYFSLAGALGNADVRQALRDAIDYQGIVRSVVQGYGAPARASATPAEWGYASSVFQQAYNALFPARQNLATATQLATASKNKKPIVFAVNADNQEMVLTATAVQNEAQQAGTNLQIKSLPTSAYNNLFFTPSTRKGIDGAFSYVTADVPDPLELIIQVRPGSPYDYTNYSAPGFANPLTAATATTSPVKRAQLVVQAQANYMDNVETLPIYSSDVRLFISKRITGPAVSELSYLYTPWAATVGAP